MTDDKSDTVPDQRCPTEVLCCVLGNGLSIRPCGKKLQAAAEDRELSFFSFAERIFYYNFLYKKVHQTEVRG